MDEEMVRKTAALINQKIIEFKNNFAGKDMQDYVSMALLWFATEGNHSSIESLKLAESAAQLHVLEKLVDKALSEEG